MIRKLIRMLWRPPASPFPPLPNAHYLGLHIAEATSKAGAR